MEYFAIALILAAFLCSLVAGFLFAFAIVVMPGIQQLNDREFLKAFLVMDRVIQDNQPIFMLVWGGSIVALVISFVLGMYRLEGSGLLLLIIATTAYLFGAQLPTFAVNVPLNKRLQKMDVDILDETMRKKARKDFEPPWNRWNTIRAIFSNLASAILIIVIFIM